MCEVNFKKLYQNIITAHALSVHIRLEFTGGKLFNVRIATSSI